MVSHKYLYEILPKHIRIFDSTKHGMPHNLYPFKQMQKIKIEHYKPQKASDYIALAWAKGIRMFWNLFGLYNPTKMNQKRWIKYLAFIETFTGVPGMVGGMCRHLQSLRLLRRDNGWIHSLLQQADNQRFHLMTFVKISKPAYFTRLGILASQAVFMTSFFSTYLFFPKYCHRFMGYLEQELVDIYSVLLQRIDDENSKMKHWKYQKAPLQTPQYYHFEKGSSTMRDLILAIRADKVNHCLTNHFFAQVPRNLDLKQQPVKIINPGEDFRMKKNEQIV